MSRPICLHRPQVGDTRAVTADTAASYNLDGLEFLMVSSTASTVDEDAPTRFRYHQDGSLVWGEYLGDTVTQGRFVGELREATLAISFAHELVSDRSVVRGQATSRVEDRDGRLYLVEDFAIDGVAHESVCVQA